MRCASGSCITPRPLPPDASSLPGEASEYSKKNRITGTGLSRAGDAAFYLGPLPC
ncbi:hypothetical protein KNP414_06026 [Paenibacillus mucilaginosus KNP414]|uniref:Uncharacterized protein n=1 Tax=Paenibacillus mucilaginosus (strain KNP414) TaxID=1036673 RepID=F8FEF1_PAEMK|nr:hypothetical protein KNP414_06026 [Paenibacillus mucilaginosus KNP414]